MRRLWMLSLVLGLAVVALVALAVPARTQALVGCLAHDWIAGELRYDVGNGACNRAQVDGNGNLHVTAQAMGSWVVKPLTTSTSIYAAGQSLGGWQHFVGISNGNGAWLAGIGMYSLAADVTTAISGIPFVFATPASYTPTTTCNDHSAVAVTTADMPYALMEETTLSNASLAFTTYSIGFAAGAQTGAFYMQPGTTDLWVCYFISTASTMSQATGVVTLETRVFQ